MELFASSSIAFNVAVLVCAPAKAPNNNTGLSRKINLPKIKPIIIGTMVIIAPAINIEIPVVSMACSAFGAAVKPIQAINKFKPKLVNTHTHKIYNINLPRLTFRCGDNQFD